MISFGLLLLILGMVFLAALVTAITIAVRLEFGVFSTCFFFLILALACSYAAYRIVERLNIDFMFNYTFIAGANIEEFYHSFRKYDGLDNKLVKEIGAFPESLFVKKGVLVPPWNSYFHMSRINVSPLDNDDYRFKITLMGLPSRACYKIGSKFLSLDNDILVDNKKVSQKNNLLNACKKNPNISIIFPKNDIKDG